MRFLMVVFSCLFVHGAFADSKKLWGGDAHIGGEFYGNVLSATTFLRAATVKIGPDEVEINIPSVSDALDAFSLIYDKSVGDIALRQISGVGGVRSRTLVVAAVDSVNPASADFICDGVADDVQINAALASLDGASGCVMLLDGNYVVTASISMTTPTLALIGQGVGITVLERGDTGFPVISCDTTNTLTIADLSIQGLSALYTDATDRGILLGNVDNSTLRNLSTFDCGGQAIRLFSSDNNLILGVFASGGLRDVYNVAVGTGNVLINCNASDGAADGFEVDGPNTIMFGCQVSGVGGRGIKAGQYNTISGCNANNCGNDGIYAGAGAGQCIIANNISYDNAGSGVYSEENYVSITGNYCYSNTGDGIELYTALFNLVANNYCHDNTDNGIELFATEKAVVNGNTLVFNDSRGVYAVGDFYSTIKNNYFQQNVVEIRMGDTTGATTEGIIQGNTFYDPTANPVITLRRATQMRIIDNQFIANGTEAGYPLELEAHGGGNSCYDIFYQGSQYSAGWPGDYELEVGQTVIPIMMEHWTSEAPAVNEVYIVSSSPTSMVAFATDDISTIQNVITVSSGAATNPIANSWDTYSDDQFKTNITPLAATDLTQLKSAMRTVESVTFDYKIRAEPFFDPDVYRTILQLAPEIIKGTTDIDMLPPDSIFVDVTETDLVYARIISGTAGMFVPEGALIVQDGYTNYENDRFQWRKERDNPNRHDILGLRVRDPNLPDRFKSYNDKGEATGLNNTQLNGYYHAVINDILEEVDALEARITWLEGGG